MQDYQYFKILPHFVEMFQYDTDLFIQLNQSKICIYDFFSLQPEIIESKQLEVR